jgi:hypothetical protein
VSESVGRPIARPDKTLEASLFMIGWLGAEGEGRGDEEEEEEEEEAVVEKREGISMAGTRKMPDSRITWRRARGRERASRARPSSFQLRPRVSERRLGER